MPQRNYIQSILSYFTSMDISNLRLHLKNDCTYEETTKEIFLNEIEAIFEAHRNSGDAKLLLFPGACAGKTCDNCSKKGYRFVGNHSKNYMDLLFEIEGDDIKDIYSCAEFKTNSESKDLGTKADIYINLDDRASFPKPEEYWARVYAAQDAYNELITTPPRKFDFEEMKYWLDKHAELYNRLGGYDVFNPQMKWTPFLICYSDLKRLVSSISENLDEIRQANQSIKDVKTEKGIIDWVLKYEAIYENGVTDLISMADKNGEDFYFDKRNLYFLEGEIFMEALRFFKFYRTENNQLLEKYSIYSSEEESELYSIENSDLDVPNLYSLQFHLKRRQELGNMDVHLSLHIKK